jgi:hypothetical protein
MKKETYIINPIPIKQMWLQENIILIKDVQNMGGSKMLKITMKKKAFNSISKDQNSKIG